MYVGLWQCFLIVFNLNYNLFRIYVNISRLLCLIQIIGNHDTVIPLIFLVDLGGNYPFNQWKLSLFLYEHILLSLKRKVLSHAFRIEI